VLLREVPFDGDGNFSWERFEERYTADLANALGNLASRAVAMVEKYRDGRVPVIAPDPHEADDHADIAAYHAALDGSRGWLLHDGLAAVARQVARANEYTAATAPWQLAKDADAAAALDTVLASLMRRLARITVQLAPFMPGRSLELWHMIGGTGDVHAVPFTALRALSADGWTVRKGTPLFPRPA
jgi:methionyl-tRNA synthetase